MAIIESGAQARDDCLVASSRSVLSDAEWLRLHFEVCRLAYSAMVSSAGFAAGDHILDAGCGYGGFLPLLAEAIGTDGQVTAIDFDRSSVLSTAHDKGAVATVTSLPFGHGVFDGVWSANVLQYLDDEAAASAIDEFVRVTRVGGRVAIKDVDMTGFRFWPADPFLMAHLSEASYRMPSPPAEAVGSLRGRELRQYLARAGLTNVRQETLVIEHHAPLDPPVAEFWARWLCYLSEIAIQRGVPETDQQTWAEIASENGRSFVGNPDFLASEVQVLAVGEVI